MWWQIELPVHCIRYICSIHLACIDYMNVQTAGVNKKKKTKQLTILYVRTLVSGFSFSIPSFVELTSVDVTENKRLMEEKNVQYPFGTL